MNIKRFVAASSREALNMVRRELGPDAVIISNKMVGDNTEILAVCNAEMESMISPRNDIKPSAPIAPAKPSPTLAELKTQEVMSILTTKQEAPTPAPSPVVSKKTSTQPSAETTQINLLMNQMRLMQQNFESRFSELSWRETQRTEPGKKEIFKNMLLAGFGSQLSRHLADKLPVNHNKKAMSWLKETLSHNILAATDESEILDQGGVFALIGPTGVGKTTTIAKIAAHFVMKHGAGKLALITTDSYRIGGHDQLRSYGKILGVMVHAVKDEADLKLALDAFKDKHTVLIDTAGVGQRHQMVGEQSDMLFNADRKIKKILCLNASCHLETLTDVVQAYGKRGLNGCIITKIDEAVSFGGMLDVVIREKLKVHYVTNGQCVPDDIHLLNKTWLMHRTFAKKEPRADSFQLSDDELPLVMSSQIYAGANLELSHV